MKKLSAILFIGSAAALLMPSCRKALDIQPAQSISNVAALSNREGVNANITGLYSRMKNVRLYGRDLIALPEALSDNGYATNKSGRLIGEANNTYRSHFGQDLWELSYKNINEANLLLAAIPNATGSPAVTQSERNVWEGQTYFIRAVNYFNLALAYAYIPGATIPSQDKGGVPIFTTGINNQDSALLRMPARAPIDSVYNLIVRDLETANVRFNGVAFNANIANKAATQAMLSRVNLYRKDYTNAKRWADSCIASNSSRLASSSDYVNQWRVSTHKETLFQLVYLSSAENIGVNESLQTSFTTLSELGNTAKTGGFGDLVPTLSLLTDLGITLSTGQSVTGFKGTNASIVSRSSDVRNLLYEVGTTGRGKSYVECTKYFGKNGFINLDNVPVIRIAEVYLNRAEAMATPGSPVYNAAAALADLKTIKSNRYTGYTGSTIETADNALASTGTPNPLLEEIIRQRRIELAFEGQRFWTYKRLGRDIIKSPTYVDVAFSDIRILAPIPQREVDYSPSLTQNPGY